MRALWFSRHTPTRDQLTEATDLGYEICAVEEGLKLGARDLATDSEVILLVTELRKLAKDNSANAIFGVASAPLLAVMANTAEGAVLRGDWWSTDLQFFAAWNVQRSPDGGKPTFSHRKWVYVGRV